MDENKQDADLQSDEQSTDLEVKVEETQDNSQDPDKEDPSDKMTSDHPRFKQVLQEKRDAEDRAAELEQKLADLEEQKSTHTDNDGLTEEERISLEKIEKNLTARGFVRQDDLRVTKNADNLRKLSEKYDGKNNLPAFNGVEVVTFAKKNGLGDNYEAAYREMNFDAIVEANAKKLSNAPKAPELEKPTSGGEQTVTKRFSREDIKNMSDADYDKYRTGLLTAIKPK